MDDIQHVYGMNTKQNDIHLRTVNTFGKKCGHLTLPPLSQCPTIVPHASSALKPVEVTLAGLVTVSNEMCSCSHSQGWDRPARRPADPPQVILLDLRLSTR